MDDVFPTTLVSRKIGEFVDDVVIDYSILVPHMRESGLTDEEILDTTIEVTDEVISKEYKNEPGNVYTTYGRYLERDGKVVISLFPAELLRAAQAHKNAGAKFIDREPEEGVSNYFSETLAHELEHHAIRTVEGGMRREQLTYAIGRLGITAASMGARVLAVAAVAYRTIEQLLPAVPIDRPEIHVGVVALAFSTSIKAADKITEEYDYYYASPEEVRCREAEQYAPNTLVLFRLKD